MDAPEVLEENRFLAVRDGVEACMVDPLTHSRVPVAELLDQVLAVGRGHARDLHCGPELERTRGLLATPGSGAPARARARTRPGGNGGRARGPVPGLRGAQPGGGGSSPFAVRGAPNETRMSAPPPVALAALL